LGRSLAVDLVRGDGDERSVGERQDRLAPLDDVRPGSVDRAAVFQHDLVGERRACGEQQTGRESERDSTHGDLRVHRLYTGNFYLSLTLWSHGAPPTAVVKRRGTAAFKTRPTWRERAPSSKTKG